MAGQKSQRFWELDALRGAAIFLMVVFHFIFDLRVFFNFEEINYQEGFWYYEGRISAIIFIVLVGVVSSLICQREDHEVAMQKNSYRGLRLIGLGMIITFVTFIFAPQDTIWFGILHFLGLAILISIPMCRFKWLNTLLAVILFAGYFQIKNLYTDNYFGIIFGILPYSFSSFDHYALIPWLGYVLIGIALGNWLYSDSKKFIKREPTTPEKMLAKTGKYSLWIYMIHQPIILGLLWAGFLIFE